MTHRDDNGDADVATPAVGLFASMRSSVVRHSNVSLVLLLVAIAELIRTAWISDDAAITLRTVLNLVNGYGARFNIDERVQAYSHPLWFLLLSGLTLITRHPYASAFLLSIGTSLLVLWLLLTRVCVEQRNAVLVGGVLLCSKAYVDFSTSGLENPLTHLLVLIALLIAAGKVGTHVIRRETAFFLCCSLAFLSRPDIPLLLLPMALFVAWHTRRRLADLAWSLAIGVLPALVWVLFSLYYYGVPVPNTAYAKLVTNIPRSEIVQQGGRYLLDSVARDPLTLLATVAGVVIGWRSTAGPRKALALGICLYVLYVVSIGGDFMSGRLFTPVLLASMLVLASEQMTTKRVLALGAAFACMAWTSVDATLLSGRNYSNTTIAADGVADERGYYFQRHGLTTFNSRGVERLVEGQGMFQLPDWTRAQLSLSGQREVRTTCGGLGFFAVSSGPSIHVIDECGLSDPLLSRIPAPYISSWRIGHGIRTLPDKYVESVQRRGNLLTEPRLRAAYDSIRAITRDPLNSPARLREVFRFNFSAAQWVFGPVSASPSSLRFGAVKAGAGSPMTSQTPAQSVTIAFSGANGTWTASTQQAWLQIAGGTGTGPGQFTVALVNPNDVIGANSSVTGSVIFTSPSVPNSPLPIPVTVTVDQTGGGGTRPPVGLVATPLQNATGVVDPIAVGGWVVDDVGVKWVKLYRSRMAFESAANCQTVNGAQVVWVGDATLVPGMRPDIDAIYPSYPQSNRVQWGFVLWAHMLPHVPNAQIFGGQATLTLRVLAEDMEGHQRWLGRNFAPFPTDSDQVPTTITLANKTIAKLFWGD